MLTQTAIEKRYIGFNEVHIPNTGSTLLQKSCHVFFLLVRHMSTAVEYWFFNKGLCNALTRLNDTSLAMEVGATGDKKMLILEKVNNI